MTYANEARKTPEQKEAEVERKDQIKRKAQITEQAIRRTFATSDGRIALYEIMDRCCYQRQITATTAKAGVDTRAMMHNAALHKHYLWLRQYVDADTLIAVEIRGLQENITE